ncbi:hypothetical protein ACFFX0_23560 [Citricoccus parietis]|uniref:Uncharacterized protein n=1 Tax=Citricoccus parietis TaxID=592307 RepID=A0ABV5G4Z5_9MICC
MPPRHWMRCSPRPSPGSPSRRAPSTRCSCAPACWCRWARTGPVPRGPWPNTRWRPGWPGVAGPPAAPFTLTRRLRPDEPSTRPCPATPPWQPSATCCAAPPTSWRR